MEKIKRCFVPICRTTNLQNSNKIFVTVPKSLEKRKKWFEAAGMKSNLPKGNNYYCCEDHFDLKEDSKNWLRFKLMHDNSTRFLLKSNVVPHKNLLPPISRGRNRLKEQEAQGVFFNIQEQETSGPSFDIKEEISIDEDYLSLPKLEKYENASDDTIDEKDPLSEDGILQCIHKVNMNFSPSNSKKRKVNDRDCRGEEDVLVKLENSDDYVDYVMSIANRLQNANQSDHAIAITKQKIELILCDFERGVFEDVIAVPCSCNS